MPDKYQGLREALAAIGDMKWEARDCIVWFDDGDSALIADPAGQRPPVFLACDNMGAWPDPINREDVAKLAALARNLSPGLLAERDALSAKLADRDAYLRTLANFGGTLSQAKELAQKALSR